MAVSFSPECGCSKKEAAMPFMTKPWKSTPVLQCPIGYTDQLYSRWKGLHWACVHEEVTTSGTFLGPCYNYTYSPSARSVLPPDISTAHTLISPDLCSKVTLLRGFPNFSQNGIPPHHSLSPLMLFYFSLLHLEHLTVTYLHR